MYRRVEAALILENISKKELASIIGLTYNTLLLKLKGVSPFTLDEAFDIKKAINSDEPIERLFIRDKSTSPA